MTTNKHYIVYECDFHRYTASMTPNSLLLATNKPERVINFLEKFLVSDNYVSPLKDKTGKKI